MRPTATASTFSTAVATTPPAIVTDLVAAGGGAAVAHRCDVTDARAVEAVVDEIAGEGVYALVNNAAVLRDGHFLLMDEARWELVVDTVLTAAYRLTRAFLRPMLHAGAGRIVNVGSLAGVVGQAGQANYVAAKGGLHAFGKALAREVGRYGITVNAVVPGWVETDLVEGLGETRKARAIASIPLGRFGRPAEVAGSRGFPALGRGLLHHGHDAASGRRAGILRQPAPRCGSLAGGRGEGGRADHGPGCPQNWR